MKHKGTVRIETDRLILRKFTRSDSEATFRNWTSDNKVTKFLRWKAHENITQTQNLIEQWVGKSEKEDFYHWAIELKELGEPIGTISCVVKNEQLDILHIGYCIGSKWWHKGFTTEAFSAIIPFLFEKVGANRIESQHDPDNPNSGLVMKKCGLKYEGTLRQSDYSNMGIVDACMYSLLKEEYKSGRRNPKFPEHIL